MQGRKAFDTEVFGVVKNERNSGFTLFELIVTIAVAAIVVSFGVPAFTSFIQNNRATTDTNDLVTALNLARNEATRRGASVLVCSSSNGTSCSNSDDWSSGWIVQASGDVLRIWPERSDSTDVLTADVSQVQFQARGSLPGGSPTFEIRLPDCTGNQGRDVSVNAAGRISVDRVACQ